MTHAITRFDYVHFATGQVDPFVPADVATPAAPAPVAAKPKRRRRGRYMHSARLG